MSTYLIISVSARKEVELQEVEVFAEEEDQDPFDFVIPHINPPHNGKCIVVDKKDIRIFRLRCEVTETNV